VPGGDGRSIAFDSVSGVVRASAESTGAKTASISVEHVPSFVLHAGLPLKVGSRLVRVDVAFAGGFYAIVDGESAGVGVAPPFLPELRRTALQIKREIEHVQTIAHPENPMLKGIEGVVFTAPPEHEADLRSATVSGEGAVDRSPGEAATCALLAVLTAMGLIERGSPFVHESISGARFVGRVREPTAVGAYEAIVPEVEGSAWIIGEHVFFIDDADPFGDGLSGFSTK